MLVVLYMRQRALNVAWWHALLAAAALMALFARELALPANAFYAFFARYVIGATAVTALLARLLPAHLLSEMPEVLFRIGILSRPAAAAAPQRGKSKKAQ